MTDESYFKSPAIGSSILGACIVRADPFEICTDLATTEVKPTKFMEAGKMFEDQVEEAYSNSELFSDKYFHSSIDSLPETSRKDLKNILDMLDGENIKEDVDSGYVFKKDGEWSSTYANRNQCLEEIAAHDYRRPIPDPVWKKLEVMLERFGNYPFRIGDETAPLKSWLRHDGINVEFQVEHFWKHESGAECRAKFDMIWTWKIDGDIWAMPFDLKVTANYPSFEQSWKYRYIWQSKHYMEGFKSYCEEKGFIACENIWYLIQESKPPFITHARALSAQELDNLNKSYNKAIPKIWKWIEAGKPVRGYVKQKTVDRWGRPENI